MFNINKWYVLKYVNYNLAVFKVENGVISELTINSKNARYFPTNHINREDILDWIHNRSLPVTRDGVKKDLGDLTPFEYMLINKGLSLTDHYWFSDVESTDTWESVNCFDNVLALSQKVVDGVKLSNCMKQ